jgi:hypothetical protein
MEVGGPEAYEESAQKVSHFIGRRRATHIHKDHSSRTFRARRILSDGWYWSGKGPQLTCFALLP